MTVMYYDNFDSDYENGQHEESNNDFENDFDSEVKIEEEAAHDAYNFFPDFGF